MDMSTLSSRNCSITSKRRAPSDFRTPISCVRSVTLTSMMFMITMPPTTSEMQVTGTTTAEIMPRIWSIIVRTASGVTTSNVSALLGGVLKRARSATRVMSMASSSFRPSSGRGRANTAMDWPVPNMRVNTV